MKLHHMLLAGLTSATWRLAFVATKFGLESFSASQLTAICLSVTHRRAAQRHLAAVLSGKNRPRPHECIGVLPCGANPTAVQFS
jgi:hypothetical protein